MSQACLKLSKNKIFNVVSVCGSHGYSVHLRFRWSYYSCWLAVNVGLYVTSWVVQERSRFKAEILRRTKPPLAHVAGTLPAHAWVPLVIDFVIVVCLISSFVYLFYLFAKSISIMSHSSFWARNLLETTRRLFEILKYNLNQTMVTLADVDRIVQCIEQIKGHNLTKTFIKIRKTLIRRQISKMLYFRSYLCFILYILGVLFWSCEFRQYKYWLDMSTI